MRRAHSFAEVVWVNAKDDNATKQAFVLNQTDGTWGIAEEVAGVGAVNSGGSARTSSVSCASAGNCSAGGYYTGGSGLEAFVVNETGGHWGTAQALSGTSQLSSLSCGAAGNCSAGGIYNNGTEYVPVVVSEKAGSWGTTEAVAGLSALNPEGSAFVNSVSCGAAGSCSAGGSYDINGSVGSQAFVVDETGGTWGNAENVPGTNPGSPTIGNGSSIASISCVSASRCTASGYNLDSSGDQQAFVAARG